MAFEPIDPALARDKLDKLKWGKKQYWAELKYDGIRYNWYVGHCPYDRSPSALLSRRVSDKDNLRVDKWDRVPHITKNYPSLLKGAQFDGEGFVPGKDFYHTMGIMNSEPAEAIRRQVESGYIHLRLWDVMQFQGDDLRRFSLKERRAVLQQLVPLLESPYVEIAPKWEVTSQDEADALFSAKVAEGYEGLIIKDVDAPYGNYLGHGMAKMKMAYEFSTFVSGFIPGKGKYEGQIGSLCLSVYDGDKEREVATASGMDDEMRLKISQNPSEYMHRVVDIFGEQLTTDVRVRHPTFKRWRDDMSHTECTLEKLHQDFQMKKAASKREK